MLPFKILKCIFVQFSQRKYNIILFYKILMKELDSLFCIVRRYYVMYMTREFFFFVKTSNRCLNNNVTNRVLVREGESQVPIIAFIIIHEKPWNLFLQYICNFFFFFNF